MESTSNFHFINVKFRNHIYSVSIFFHQKQLRSTNWQWRADSYQCKKKFGDSKYRSLHIETGVTWCYFPIYEDEINPCGADKWNLEENIHNQHSIFWQYFDNTSLRFFSFLYNRKSSLRPISRFYPKKVELFQIDQLTTDQTSYSKTGNYRKGKKNWIMISHPGISKNKLKSWLLFLQQLHSFVPSWNIGWKIKDKCNQLQ